jgi:putative photosynthetic complex assembly protein
MHASGTPSFPVAPLTAVGLMLLAALLAVSLVRFTGVGLHRVPDAPTVRSAELRFQDQADGGVVVLHGEARTPIARIEPGSHGFLRSTLRGLARERKRQGLGPELPYQLLARADGRLTLLDPATARRIDLESFGAPNAAVFADLLHRATAP